MRRMPTLGWLMIGTLAIALSFAAGNVTVGWMFRVAVGFTGGVGGGLVLVLPGQCRPARCEYLVEVAGCRGCQRLQCLGVGIGEATVGPRRRALAEQCVDETLRHKLMQIVGPFAHPDESHGETQ